MKKLGIVFVLVILIQGVFAAHYLTGLVEDALDGENSDGKEVILWNPTVGILDNVSDNVGVSGNSGMSGVYMVDCEMLGGGCVVSDILSLKIFGDRYISWIVNVTVTGFGYDVVGNLSLNSPPDVSLVFPEDSGYAPGSVDFNCSFFDYDDNVDSVSLWGNWSGTWAEEGSVSSGFEDGYVVFNKELVQGSYKWNCFVEDVLKIGSFGNSNNSFFVDTTLPMVYGVVSESPEVCGFGNVAVNCSAWDLGSGIDSVVVQSISPSNDLDNYSASHISGDVYGASVLVDEIGDWSFKCFVNDSVGNLNSSLSGDVEVFSGNPELFVVGDFVGFDITPSVEGEVVNVSVNISNVGCVDSGTFVVGFYDGVDSFANRSVSVVSEGFLNISALWFTDIGLSDIFVYVDSDGDVIEDDEGNNDANGSIYMKAWQGIFGNMSLDKVLGSGNVNMNFWAEEGNFNGNIFVADSESDVDWNNLQAIGRTKTGVVSSNDFSEIDSILEMSSYNDSVDIIYEGSDLGNFSVFQRNITDVSFVNSSANGNFVTGILWDMSDSLDAEYDSGEGEDIVFVAKVNRGQVGSYGVYDYEIDIPSKLRSYDAGDESSVYLYYDLN